MSAAWWSGTGPCVAEHVRESQQPEQVAGERVPADHHPRVAPDRHRRTPPGHRPHLGQRPLGARRGQPVRPDVEDLGEEPIQGIERLLDRLGHGDPDLDAALPEPAYVELAVLLLVGHHEVGLERGDRGQVGVLGAPDPRDVEVGRVGAPVGRPDQHVGNGRGERLGDRRHQRDHPGRSAGQGDRTPQVVHA